MCKVVQRGDWAGLLDYKKVPLLPTSNKRKAAVTHADLGRNAIAKQIDRTVRRTDSCRQFMSQCTDSHKRAWGENNNQL